MDVLALQQQLRDFAADRDWQPFHTPKNLAMALMVEAAELLELFQWQTLSESRAFTRDPANKERVADEIADVLLYLLQLADHTGVDVEQAVECKLLKNAQKHPAKHAKSIPTVPAVVSVAATKTHLLVDWENVQPAGNALKSLVPEGTDVWLFHGPHQKLDDSSHRQTYGSQVTLVPRSGAGRNALDFQLTYYVGYIAARQPDATFVVVSNDHGYDPMLAHACELGFKARRCRYERPPVPAVSAALPDVSSVVPTAMPTVVVSAPAKAKQIPSAEAALTNTRVKATRQDVQQLSQLLAGMAPAERPVRKGALLALIQRHLGETQMRSPRVAHALAQLQSLKQVALKKDAVSYPLQVAVPPALAKEKASPKPVATSARPVARQPTAAQIARAVLASLEKMPKNKPTRRVGLLRFIETHATRTADPKSTAQLVYRLLEARNDVAPLPDGQGVVYPTIRVEKAPSA